MDETSGKLTVFFEGPFWVGVFEHVYDGKVSVCKVTFGSEPKDHEVWEFVLKHYSDLRFGPAVETESKRTVHNSKRRQREAGKQVKDHGPGTKSQRLLAMQREEIKTERKSLRREQKEAEKQKRFDLKQQKRKEKHKGH